MHINLNIFNCLIIRVCLTCFKLKLNQSSCTQIQLLLSLDGAPLVTMVTGTRKPYADSVMRECDDISQGKKIMALSPICCVMPAAFLTDPFLKSAF